MTTHTTTRQVSVIYKNFEFSESGRFPFQREFLLSKIFFLSFFFSTIRILSCIVTAKIPFSYDDIYSPRLAWSYFVFILAMNPVKRPKLKMKKCTTIWPTYPVQIHKQTVRELESEQTDLFKGGGAWRDRHWYRAFTQRVNRGTASIDNMTLKHVNIS